jgi:TRAP transporter TAXI family solute receptor
MLPHRLRALLGLLAMSLLLAACEPAPDEAAVRQIVEQRLAEAYQPPALRLLSLRRMGSGPLAAGPDGEARRIVYFNATLAFERDLDFTSWGGLNLAAFANLLGATEQGISGLKQGGNRAGDAIRVHGGVYFERSGDGWAALPSAVVAVAAAPPEDNTGLPAEARQLIEQIRTLLDQGVGPAEARRQIIAEELQRAYGWISVRIDRLAREFVIVGGQPGGEYARVAAIIARHLGTRGLDSQAVTTAGSVENARLVHQGLADIALVQNDIAAMAASGSGIFAGERAMAELRALGSLFPEPVQVLVLPGSPIAGVADLRGQRVDIGQPDSGARINALAVLGAYGIGLEDLGAVSERGLAAGLRLLARGELDAVMTTISAPARAIQDQAAATGVRLLPISAEAIARITTASTDLVPLTLPPWTYAGQAAPVPTLAAAALLVGTAGMADATVETLLREIYGGIDFIAAGSAAGSLIGPATALVGVSLQLHPAAEKFFAAARPTQ